MLGRMTLVPNLDRKQGENNAYLYVKVQLPHGGEEHWLLTDQEVRVAQENHARHGLPAPPSRLGLVALQGGRITDVGHPWADALYDKEGRRRLSWYVVHVLHGRLVALAFEDLERIRTRVENNREDVEANAPGWLADLLD